MICPYCAEEIKDKALVCRFCHRDLTLVNELSDKLSKTEAQSSGTKAQIAEGPKRNSSQSSVVNRAAFALFLNMIVFLTFYEISWLPFARIDRPWIALAFMSPLFAGFGLGLSKPQLRLSSYFLLGLVAGSSGYGEMLMVVFYNRHGEVPPGWQASCFYYVASGILFFLLGGPLGEYLGRRRNGKAHSVSKGSTPTNGTFGIRALIGDSEKADMVIKLGTSVVAILGSIAALLTAIQGVLGTTHKQ